MTIDLHTHSTASDGTTPPAEIPLLAAKAGLDVVALTDHDTFAGLAEAGRAAADAGIELVPGVEISCRLDDAEVHLLGYFVDPADGPLAAELELIRTDRTRRAVRMVERCRELGAPITLDEVRAIAAGAPLGRPHVAAALVAAGVVADARAAFTDDWLGDGGRADVPKHVLPTAEAIALVRGAGGAAVLAHPRSEKRRAEVSDPQLAALAGAGLAGIEAGHPEQPAEVAQRLWAVAAGLGLLTTGSSDFHGDRKPVRLGDFTTPPDVLAALRERTR
ncbi:PHP domain-containing protein [Amycolatopsis sp. A133]|uniref:PHP domain-containing protein n=1 Tax=Amycolatopsis sp. A133 TaxID=3064472 RepID=UPI0027F1E4FC|nr:PHP domain-containing protein [Amycolatopsis sp. A133]MDQ7805252.1 PHP domain-containing protein [Amycolatopsis sp. A133]